MGKITTTIHDCHILKPFRGTPRCACLPASFTLEAAVILPLLTCFFVSILFFFRIMQVELQVQKALDDTGRQLAVYLSGSDGGAAELAAAEALFLQELTGSTEAGRYISGGSLGVNLLKSEFEEHEIRLNASYQIRLPIRIFGISGVAVEQRAFCRKWTGWHASGETADGSDEWVYVTEMGRVYHLTEECTHLTLSIRSVDAGAVGGLRNENGGKYRPCAVCADGKQSARVYITNMGDRYHTDLNCTGIKRTIYLIRRSEAGDLSCCSRCMGL